MFLEFIITPWKKQSRKKSILLKQKIAITALSSVAALGHEPEQIWKRYLDDQSAITLETIGEQTVPVARIPLETRQQIEALQQSHPQYRNLDPSVLFAIFASRAAVHQAEWQEDEVFGINIGSSRGATQLFEQYHQEFLETGKSATLASPTTTLGNIATWVAQDLKSKGPEISHSITCSTALHALLNGIVWLESGRCNKFLVGGSEAPLTPFTMAQMQALKIYSTLRQAQCESQSERVEDYFCRALDFEKQKNTMVLGEGASMACLELGTTPKALAYIEGIGYATEMLTHSLSISSEALCFQESIKGALQNTTPDTIDAIVMHAPGTLKGDTAEYKAIQHIFGENLPLLTTNKWKLGHTFGASGMLSVELAVFMLQHNHFVPVPYIDSPKQNRPLRKILVNAVGFGGNAVSVLLSV